MMTTQMPSPPARLGSHVTICHATCSPLLQGQLRAQLLGQLQKGADAGQHPPLRPPPAGSSAASARPGSLWARAMDALVAQHLESRQLQFSLSVFEAEAGLQEARGMSGDEVCELLRLRGQPELEQGLRDAMRGEQAWGAGRGCCCFMGLACCRRVMRPAGMARDSRCCYPPLTPQHIAWGSCAGSRSMGAALLAATAQAGSGQPAAEVACQTDTPAAHTLSRQLRALEDAYLVQSAAAVAAATAAAGGAAPCEARATGAVVRPLQVRTPGQSLLGRTPCLCSGRCIAARYCANHNPICNTCALWRPTGR